MTLRVHGRRSLKTRPGLETRPTSWRIRQIVFQQLGETIEGCRWLDVCCGVGTMGAEALGRGARKVTGIDDSATAAALTRQNWDKIRRPDQEITVIRSNARQALRRLGRIGSVFDVVYVDPPYDSPLYDSALPLAVAVLAPGGVLIVEHGRRRALAAQFGPVHATDTWVHRDSQVSFYRRETSDVPNA